jgi:hypothetical protein
MVGRVIIAPAMQPMLIELVWTCTTSSLVVSVTESTATMALMVDQVPSAAARSISVSKSTAGGSVFTHCGVSHTLHTALIRRPEHQAGRLTQPELWA